MKATDADTFIKDLPKLIRNDLTQEQANEMVKTLTEASGTARIEQMQ
jgi:ribosomal protein L7/L12